MNKLISLKNKTLYHWLDRPRQKIATHVHLVKGWDFGPKIDEVHFLLSTFPATLQCYAKKVKNLEFIECVKIEIIALLQNNGSQYLLTFGDSYGEI